MHLALLTFTLFIAQPLQASAPQPCAQVVATLQTSDLDPSGRLGALQSAQAGCALYSPYLGYQGYLLAQLNRPAEAALSLEKALMLDPSNGEALIDYSLVLYRLGRPKLALAVAQQILVQEKLPAEIRRQMREFEQTLVKELEQGIPQAEPPPNSRQALYLGLGYGTNLNAGSRAQTLNLTLSDGAALEVRLPQNYAPQAGRYADLAYSYEFKQPSQSGALKLYLDTRIDEVGAADNAALGLVYAVQGLEQSMLDTLAVDAALKQNGLNLDPYLSLKVGLDTGGPLPIDLLEFSLARKWAAKSAMDRYSQIQLTGGRAFRGKALETSIQLGLALTDYDGAYWGGRRASGSVALSVKRDFGLIGLGASVKAYRHQDAQGYSPLLDSNRPLKIEGLELGVAANLPLDAGRELLLSVGRLSESSNIDLFDRQAVEFVVGFKSLWR